MPRALGVDPPPEPVPDAKALKEPPMIRTAWFAAALTALPAAAFAHPGHGGAGGFTHGFMHPLGGLDHVAVMVAVGLMAARLGGRALWMLPASFIGLMTIGGAMGMMGAALPFTELMIGLSVGVMLLALVLRWSLPAPAAAAMVGAFALVHGLAHGAETPENASGLAFAGGFILATALLHGLGVSAGLVISRRSAFVRSR
jgi:urease accessory protein